MCQAALCEETDPCVGEWEQDQQARLERAYAPILPPEDALRRACVAEMRRRNALQPIPDPVCKKCGFPNEEMDMDVLFRKHCSTCGCQRLEELVMAIYGRLGRKRTLKALKRLAKKGK